MRKDLGRYTIYINRFYLDNWGLGLDFYRLYDQDTRMQEASVLQVSILFFNITITRWHRWI